VWLLLLRLLLLEAEKKGRAEEQASASPACFMMGSEDIVHAEHSEHAWHGVFASDVDADVDVSVAGRHMVLLSRGIELLMG